MDSTLFTHGRDNRDQKLFFITEFGLNVFSQITFGHTNVVTYLAIVPHETQKAIIYINQLEVVVKRSGGEKRGAREEERGRSEEEWVGEEWVGGGRSEEEGWVGGGVKRGGWGSEEEGGGGWGKEKRGGSGWVGGGGGGGGGSEEEEWGVGE